MGTVNFGTFGLDVASFVSAQDELRANAGTTAAFGVPATPDWPAGTAINPDTNLPYDATVVQSNAQYDVVEISVLVIEKQGSPLRPGADPSFNQSGLREGIDIILDVGASDYQETVANASMFTLAGDDFNIEEAKPFTIFNTTYRYLVYGAAR